jgi:O-antigen/teichoic acid export membrane protein
MNRESPPPKPPHRGDTISRNALFAFATQMSTALFTAALTVYLVRALGPAAYGTFALATGIVGIVLRPSDVGTTQSAARFVAERHGDVKAIRAVLGMALRTRLLTASAIGLALFLAAGPIAALYNAPELAWPLRGVAIALFGQALTGFVLAVFIALRRTSKGFTLVISESVVEFTATVGLVLLAGGATAASFGRAVGYVFGAALGVVLLGRFFGRSPLFKTGRSPVARREFASYAGAMFIVQGAFTAFTQIDVLLIGGILSTSAVAFFSAPIRLISFLGYPGQAIAQGVAPRMARHPDQPPNVAALQQAIRYVMILQAGLVAFIIVWAGPVVDVVLGSKFAESEGVLRALAPFVFLGGFGPLLVSPLNYFGEARRRIPIAIGTVILNGVIDIILLRRIGVVGAAIGTDVAYALYVGAHLRLSHRLLGLRLRPLTSTAVRVLLAAGAMATALALVGTADLSVVDWISGLVLGSGAFLAMLLATRELSLGEVRSISNMAARALRGG